MNFLRLPFSISLLVLPAVLTAGCAKSPAPASAEATPPKHQHHPPHGGTPIVLGDEAFHVELVRDADSGTLTAYILDDEMEEFVRIGAPSLTIDAQLGGSTRQLVLTPVASPATGETVGNTSQFEASADWLKSAAQFDASLEPVTIHGTDFPATPFNFPHGNDKD